MKTFGMPLLLHPLPSLSSYLTPCFSLILFSPSPFFPLFFPSFPLSTPGMTYIVTSGDLL